MKTSTSNSSKIIVSTVFDDLNSDGDDDANDLNDSKLFQMVLNDSKLF